MVTISDIFKDISRGCMANNMIEDCFSYRVIFFVNEGGTGTKHYIDSTYNDLRKTLESIIRNNLSVENSIVVAQTTAIKDGECVSLQSRAYLFSLSEYFQQITGERKNSGRNRNIMYGCVYSKG